MADAQATLLERLRVQRERFAGSHVPPENCYKTRPCQDCRERLESADDLEKQQGRISGALAICEEWINDDAGKRGSPETIVAIHAALEGTQQ